MFALVWGSFFFFGSGVTVCNRGNDKASGY